jgi:hypothetical protein
MLLIGRRDRPSASILEATGSNRSVLATGVTVVDAAL